MASLSPKQESKTDDTSATCPPTEDDGSIPFQWVDYLPSQLQHAAASPFPIKTFRHRPSMDVSGRTPHTESASMDDEDDGMDLENNMQDWPDSNSLEGYQLLPPAMLIDQDPVIQQQLLLSDGSSCAPELFAHSLEELLEQRRIQLLQSMQASQRTRTFLEPHIRQRAGLSNVLQQIERSSMTLHHHFGVFQTQRQQQSQQAAAAAAATSTTTTTTTPATIPEEGQLLVDQGSCNSVDMTGVDDVDEDVDPDVEDFAAQVLAGHDDDDVDGLLLYHWKRT